MTLSGQSNSHQEEPGDYRFLPAPSWPDPDDPPLRATDAAEVAYWQGRYDAVWVAVRAELFAGRLDRWKRQMLMEMAHQAQDRLRGRG